jgi:hypothetical protein
MIRIAIALCLVAGCSKEPAKERPIPAAPPAPAAPAAPAAPGSTAPLSFVPGSISAQLRDANTLIAIDLGRLQLGKVAAVFEKDTPCVAALLTKVGTVVIGEGEGYVTKLPEAETRKCLGELAPLFGLTIESKDLVIGGDRYSLVWTDGMLRVTKVGGTQSAKLSDHQRARIAKVPSAAKGWIVSNGYPKYKIKESVFWLETTDTHWRFTIEAEGSEPGSARPWVASVIEGFKQGLAGKGFVADDTWFTLTSTDTTAKLVGSIPTSFFDLAAAQAR